MSQIFLPLVLAMAPVIDAIIGLIAGTMTIGEVVPIVLGSMLQGVKVVFVTGRSSPVVDRRGRELGVYAILQGRRDKREALEELQRDLGIDPRQCAYMGDDLVDLPAMLACGSSGAPADARPEVRAAATWVAPSNGGHGAVRDYCEHLLHGMGVWEEIRERFGA